MNGALNIQPLREADLTSLRLASQVGIAAAAPFVLWAIAGALFAEPGAGMIVGTVFGTALIIRTTTEATQADAEHTLKLAHAAELSRIEVKEREAALPKRSRAGRQVLPATIAQPVPDPEEEDRVLMAADVRYVFEQGIRRGTFARADFIVAGKARLKLPSGDELTRPKFEQVIASLMADGLLVKGVNGSPALPGQSGRQVGGKALPDEMPIVITDAKRIGGV